MSRETLSVRAQ